MRNIQDRTSWFSCSIVPSIWNGLMKSLEESVIIKGCSLVARNRLNVDLQGNRSIYMLGAASSSFACFLGIRVFHVKLLGNDCLNNWAAEAEGSHVKLPGQRNGNPRNRQTRVQNNRARCWLFHVKHMLWAAIGNRHKTKRRYQCGGLLTRKETDGSKQTLKRVRVSACSYSRWKEFQHMQEVQ